MIRLLCLAALMPVTALAAPPPMADRRRGVETSRPMSEADFVTMASWHANLFRWQRYAGASATDTGAFDKFLEQQLADLDRTLVLAQHYGLKVVIDPFQDPPGGRYPNHDMVMFYEPKWNDYFVALWQRLAGRYREHPAVYGYDLVNEPVETKPPPEGLGYLATQARAAQAIRQIDARTPIIIESKGWASAEAFATLAPVDTISNVIYSAHMYAPQPFTHQGLYAYPMGLVYPGVVNGKSWDKAQLRTWLAPVRDFQVKHNARIYLGEFSAIRYAAGAAQWLTDVIDLFEEYGWDWTYHAFREFDGWSVEAQNLPRTPVVMATTDTDRKLALLAGLSRNTR